jgi:ABC-2 type transport system permease protein
MTATATPERTRHEEAPAPVSRLAGTGTLVRFALRRDRVKLPAWTVGFALFVTYLATAIPSVYDEEELVGMGTALLGDPMGRLLTGPGYGMEDIGLDQLIGGGYGLYFLILVALMSILLVSRHTRVEEQTGRAELIRANVVGRHAPLTATFVVAVTTNVLVGAVTTLSMIGFGLAVPGSLLFGAGLAAVGLAFAGVAAITVQLTENSRPASGMAGAVLGLSFVLRGAGDAAEPGGTLLSWLSPLGWGQQTAPFVLDRWWPLLLALALAAGTATIGFALSVRRDVGASVFATRPGPARAAEWVGSGTTLSLRLQRSSIGWWAAALTVSGLMYGGFTDTMIDAFAELPEAFVELMGVDQDLVGGYIGFMAFFQALLVAVFAILAVHTLRNEETSGRAEPVLATATSRWSWMGGHLAVTAVAVVGLLTAVGLATGLAAWAVTGETEHIGPATLSHVAQSPAVLVLLGVAALLYGIRSRLVPLAWILLGYALFAGVFGQLMDLPDWVYGISPYEHLPQMPREEFELLPTIALTGIALALATAGLVALRRRGIEAV